MEFPSGISRSRLGFSLAVLRAYETEAALSLLP
jgi:hypothetical protein